MLATTIMATPTSSSRPTYVPRNATSRIYEVGMATYIRTPASDPGMNFIAYVMQAYTIQKVSPITKTIPTKPAL